MRALSAAVVALDSRVAGALPTTLNLDGMAEPDAFAAVDASIDAALAAHVAVVPSAAAAAPSGATKGKKRRRRTVAEETIHKVTRYDAHAASVPRFACALSAADLEKRESGKLADTKGAANMMTVGLRAIGRYGDEEAEPRTALAAEDTVQQGDVLFRVAIFHPTRVAKAQEFIVLGRQEVTALFDHPSLFCLVDYMATACGGGGTGASSSSSSSSSSGSSGSGSSSSTQHARRCYSALQAETFVSTRASVEELHTGKVPAP